MVDLIESSKFRNWTSGVKSEGIFNSLGLAFLTGVSLFMAYAMAFNWNLIDVPIIFWLLLVFMGGVLLARILTAEQKRQTDMALLGILVLLLSVRTALLLSVPRLYAFDPYQEMRISNFILENGWNLGGPEFELYRITYISPVIHFLAAQLHLTTDLDMEWIVKWIPLVYTLGSVLIVYLIGRSFTGSPKAGVLIAFAFANVHMFLLFHALFVRESLAFVFFLGTIFAYLEGKKRKSWRMVFIAVVFGLVTVLTHHMTAFLLGLFFVVVGIIGLLASAVMTRTSSSRHVFRARTAGALRVLSFGFLITVSTIGYWAYLRFTPLQVLVTALLDASRFQPAFFDAPNTIRIFILLYGEVLYAVGIGILALGAVLIGPYRRSRWGLPFVVWGAIMGIISVALLQRLIVWAQIGTTFMAGRFQTFGYPFLFVLGIGYLVHRSGVHPKMNHFTFVFLLAFMLLSAYRLPPYLYSSMEPDWAAGEEKFYLTDSDHSALLFEFDTSGRIAADPFYGNFLSPIRDKFEENYKFNRRMTFEDPFGTTRVRWENTTFDYVLIRTLWIQSITSESEIQYKAIQQIYNKVYSNGPVEIYSD